MSVPRTVLPDAVPDHSTARILATVQDETGAAIPGNQLVTLAITLRAPGSGNEIVNSIEDVNVLNTGRGTVDGAGLFTLTLDVADNVLVDDALRVELHRLFVHWTYGAAGAKAGRYEVDFDVWNTED